MGTQLVCGRALTAVEKLSQRAGKQELATVLAASRPEIDAIIP